MYIAILGRQPNISMAELEKVHGSENVSWFSPVSATVDTPEFSIERLGGTQKAGRIVLQLPRGDWRQASMKIIAHYTKKWAMHEGKITLGLSAYGLGTSSREVQKTGIILKQKLKNSNISLRLVPNTEPALNTATSHHNKLGLSENKMELLIIRGADGRVVVAESIGAQNITSLARRDQGRPKRDAFVGMLPPKLAQIMINLATPQTKAKHIRLLDPFCGTGVILQEAALMGFSVYGTDLADKMIDYSKANLEWLASIHNISINSSLHQGDAMNTTWQSPIDAVAAESYLGQPFSAPPSPPKLAEVRRNCNHIISSFLQNIAGQLQPGTPLCIAVPAWKDTNGTFTHLPLINQLETLGFTRFDFSHIKSNDLLYYREDQVVARELLVLSKA
jgi:tRNA G10  N-methylase Trm11